MNNKQSTASVEDRWNRLVREFRLHYGCSDLAYFVTHFNLLNVAIPTGYKPPIFKSGSLSETRLFLDLRRPEHEAFLVRLIEHSIAAFTRSSSTIADTFALPLSGQDSVAFCAPLIHAQSQLHGFFIMKRKADNGEADGWVSGAAARRFAAAARQFDDDNRHLFAAASFRLTERELSVLANAASGMTSIQTAHNLGLSKKTVESYLESARKKTNSQNTAEAAAKAVFFKLI